MRNERALRAALMLISVWSAVIAGAGMGIYRTLIADEPVITRLEQRQAERERITSGSASKLCFRAGKSWLRRNTHGLWELYVEGSPYALGYSAGSLTRELASDQERYFVASLEKMLPSALYRNFLRIVVAWFNRDLDDAVSDEYRREIFGVSRWSDDRYDYIGPKYQRILNYHAAHDVGHALVNMKLAGCSSFAVRGSRARGGGLFIGRNFDFYVGDDFARDRIVAFYAPERGHRFMMVTWGGMIGAVSAMNETGLTVTLNAAENRMPKGSGVPISLIAREIVQYASTIDEAYAIASRRQSFVSESIMIGSAKDKSAAIIEKTPSGCFLYREDDDVLISTNHFQGEASFYREESSVYRYERIAELLNVQRVLGPNEVAGVLRDRYGKGGRSIGFGNEKCVNQFLAHHAVIFEPEEKRVWVSTQDNQLGAFIMYDLDEVFSRTGADSVPDGPLDDSRRIIPADPFVATDGYHAVREYRTIVERIKPDVVYRRTVKDAPELAARLVVLNPDFFEAYHMAGALLRDRGDRAGAAAFFSLALEREVARKEARNAITRERDELLKPEE